MYRFTVRYFHPLTAIHGKTVVTILAATARAALDRFEQEYPGDIVTGIDLSDSDRTLLCEVETNKPKV